MLEQPGLSRWARGRRSSQAGVMQGKPDGGVSGWRLHGRARRFLGLAATRRRSRVAVAGMIDEAGGGDPLQAITERFRCGGQGRAVWRRRAPRVVLGRVGALVGVIVPLAEISEQCGLLDLVLGL